VFCFGVSFSRFDPGSPPLPFADSLYMWICSGNSASSGFLVFHSNFFLPSFAVSVALLTLFPIKIRGVLFFLPLCYFFFFLPLLGFEISTDLPPTPRLVSPPSTHFFPL